MKIIGTIITVVLNNIRPAFVQSKNAGAIERRRFRIEERTNGGLDVLVVANEIRIHVLDTKVSKFL